MRRIGRVNANTVRMSFDQSDDGRMKSRLITNPLPVVAAWSVLSNGSIFYPPVRASSKASCSSAYASRWAARSWASASVACVSDVGGQGERLLSRAHETGPDYKVAGEVGANSTLDNPCAFYNYLL
jgi:hypothetical protein